MIVSESVSLRESFVEERWHKFRNRKFLTCPFLFPNVPNNKVIAAHFNNKQTISDLPLPFGFQKWIRGLGLAAKNRLSRIFKDKPRVLFPPNGWSHMRQKPIRPNRCRDALKSHCRTTCREPAIIFSRLNRANITIATIFVLFSLIRTWSISKLCCGFKSVQ